MRGSPRIELGLRRYRTRAWSTSIELGVTAPEHIVPAARMLHDEVDRMDRLASRFRPDSEIAGLHRRAGRPVPVSRELLEILALARWVTDVTDGAVDPTVGAALCRLGYDRDFAEVAGGVDGVLPFPAPVPGWQNVLLDEAAGTVQIPVGLRFDLGATAKALTADRIAQGVHRHLGCGVVVSLGGDVAAAGPVPAGGFVVAVDESCEPGDTAVAVSIAGGGLATSGVTVRRWSLGSSTVHHVVDPTTGLPAAPVWRTVSVAAATCLEANAASTAALVKGAGAPEWLASLGLPARLVAMDGAVRRTGGWPSDDAGDAGNAAGNGWCEVGAA